MSLSTQSGHFWIHAPTLQSMYTDSAGINGKLWMIDRLSFLT